MPSLPPLIRLPVVDTDQVRYAMLFADTCISRNPAARIRIFAFGPHATMYHELDERAVVNRNLTLTAPTALDIELAAIELAAAARAALAVGDAHLDVSTVGAVTFAVPSGRWQPFAAVAGPDAQRSLTAAMTVFEAAVTAAAHQQPSSSRIRRRRRSSDLTELYEVLLSETVFTATLDAEPVGITLRPFWAAHLFGFAEWGEDQLCYLSGDQRWMQVEFAYGSVAVTDTT